MTSTLLSTKLTKGDQVLFQVWNGKPLTLYFKNSLNDKQGFFTDEQGGGPYRKDYKNIIKINGKALNEIKVNPKGQKIKGTILKNNSEWGYIDIPEINEYGRFNRDKSKIQFIIPSGIDEVKKYLSSIGIPFQFIETGGYDEGSFILDSKYFELKNDIQEMTKQQIIKEELENIIQQNKQEVLTFENNPLEYILKKYPSLNETLIDLLTKEFRDYITGIFILAPKPTIFKILLHNGQFFYLTYTTQGYTAKVSGKQYSLMNLKEQEYAIKSISNLLLLGLPPSAQGPTEETDNNADMKNNFMADMTSEPGDDLGLDGVDSSPETTPGEEQPEEEKTLKEQEEPKKITKFRIIS